MKTIIYSVILFTIFPFFSFSQGVTDKSWHQRSSDKLWGVNSAESKKILSETKKESKNVIVALITDGVDTTNTRINSSLLRKGNAIVGWNFLGSKDGKINVNSVGTESFRIFQLLHVKYMNTDPKTLTTEVQKQEYEVYLKRRAENGIDGYIKFFKLTEMIHQGAMMADSVVLAQFGKRDIPIGDLSKLNLENIPEQYEIYFQAIGGECQKGLLTGLKSWTEVFEKVNGEYNIALNRINSLGDAKSNPRLKLGDDVNNFKDKNYGNRDLMSGEFAEGTALASIIAANSSASDDYSGVANNASIMVLRTTPKGEAFDKDIYNALYFAIDGGAKVIVIPFVKAELQRSAELEKALLYAKQKDVVVVMAAGDKAVNIDENPVYPSAQNMDNVIRVGASDYDGTKAKFSNYGKKSVDIFAPGQEVVATVENGKMTKVSGTSISASIVAGVVATLRSYYPKLSASEIKSLLVSTARPMAKTVVPINKGTIELTPGELSVAGGVVDMKAVLNKMK